MIGGVGLFDKSPLSGGIGKDFGTLTGGASGAASIGQSFADMLADAAGRTVNTMQQAEQVSVKALQGDADTRAVVDAVMSAEQSLQAAVAIRDKIVTAYLEISRMAI